MIKTFSKITALFMILFFILLGCEDKTVVTENKAQVVQEKSLPQKAVTQGKIETH